MRLHCFVLFALCTLTFMALSVLSVNAQVLTSSIKTPSMLSLSDIRRHVGKPLRGPAPLGDLKLYDISKPMKGPAPLSDRTKLPRHVRGVWSDQSILGRVFRELRSTKPQSVLSFGDRVRDRYLRPRGRAPRVHTWSDSSTVVKHRPQLVMEYMNRLGPKQVALALTDSNSNAGFRVTTVGLKKRGFPLALSDLPAKRPGVRGVVKKTIRLSMSDVHRR